MKETTRTFLLNYLGDETKWPFLWDGTMGGKYGVGSVYFRLLASVRDGYDILVLTPYGYRLRKLDGTWENEQMYQKPTAEFVDSMSLILARDRRIRRLAKKIWETETPDGLEVAYAIDPEAFAEHRERLPDPVILKSPDEAEAILKANPYQPRRAVIPTVALAQSVTFTDKMMQVSLKDGRVISVPIAWFPVLHQATPEQRARCEVVGGGLSLYWPELEEDVLVASLLAGADWEGWSQVDETWQGDKQA